MSIKTLTALAATATAAAAIALAPTANAVIWGANPYKTDGAWLVPTEIAAGTYRVSPTDPPGYSKLCADYTCEIGTPGFIDNELYPGPGVLVVPTNAVLVHLRGVTLTAMG